MILAKFAKATFINAEIDFHSIPTLEVQFKNLDVVQTQVSVYNKKIFF
jgi:hypothetical protein